MKKLLNGIEKVYEIVGTLLAIAFIYWAVYKTIYHFMLDMYKGMKQASQVMKHITLAAKNVVIGIKNKIKDYTFNKRFNKEFPAVNVDLSQYEKEDEA